MGHLGKIIWLLFESILYWCVIFYVIRSALYFYKNKNALKALEIKKYFWISVALGVVYVLFNYGAALWH